MHIAVVAPSLLGRLHATFELVSRLENEGHQVTYLCDAATAKSINSQGFNHIKIPAINFNFTDPDQKLNSWWQKLKFHLKNFGEHYRRGKSLLDLEEYQRIISKLKPDKVLVDVEIHDLIFASLAVKIPVTLYHTWYSDTRSVCLPPIRSSIIPGNGFSGSKAGIILAWIKISAMTYGRLLINRVTFSNYRREVISRYAKEIGFDRKDMRLSTLPPLFSFKKMPILTFAMTEMEFPHKAATNLRYVGPMVFTKRVDTKCSDVDKQRLSKIFKVKAEANKKLIYCSGSSYVKNDPLFLKKVIQAVKGQNEWIAILATGDHMKIASLGELPDNVYVFSWVEQLKVLEKADCCITHAGKNSMNECIHFSVPMLAYSGKNFDQNGNAARIAYHGIGIRGDKDIEDSATIRQNIKKVLTDPSYASKMATKYEVYQTYRQQFLTSHL